MIRKRLYRLVERPEVFRWIQRLTAPGAGALLGRTLEEATADSRGCVLDVGCGPAPFAPGPSVGSLLGVDLNAAYLRTFLTPGRRNAVQATAERLPFVDACFPEVRCLGVLHHLPDLVAAQALREMSRCVRPGGRILIFDNVWPRFGLRWPIVYPVRLMDRGACIRTEEDLRMLVTRAVPGGWTSRRFTYSYNGLEGLLLSLRVPSA